MFPTATRRAVLAMLLVLVATSLGCSFRRKLNAGALRPRPNYTLIPADYGLTPETLWVPVDGATIHAWVFPTPDPVGTVVICHGNTGNKALFLPAVSHLEAAGYEVVLFDYRGFGLSSGDQNFFTMLDDAVLVIDTLHARAPDRPLAMFGISLGSAVATLVARERPDAVHALVLESMFSPREGCRRVVGKLLGSLVCPAVVPRRLEVRRQLPRLAQPILMLHGDQDELTPLVSAARMFRRKQPAGVSREFWLATGAGHTPDLVGSYGRVYERRIRDFLDTHVSRRATSRSPSHVTPLDRPGVFEARFEPEVADENRRTPVRVSIVHASGETAVHRRWLEPGELSISTAVDERPLLLGARVVTDPVEPDGDGWAESDLRTNRRIKELEESLKERLGSKHNPFMLLGYGDPQVTPEKGLEWKTFVLGTEEEPAETKTEALLDLKEQADEVAEAAESPQDRARAARLLARVGAALELADRRDEAHDAYIEALDRLPENPHTVILFGDEAWEAADVTVAPALNRLIELASDADERLRWVRALGEFEHHQTLRSEMLFRWRIEQVEARP